MSKHGDQMSKRFEEQEKARRERLGKATEAPKPEVKPTVQMAEEDRPFVNRA
jgi:ribosomal protein L13E